MTVPGDGLGRGDNGDEFGAVGHLLLHLGAGRDVRAHFGQGHLEK